MLLSDRMRGIVGLVKPCNVIADIGCDHGYVAMELVKNGTCKGVIATDINHGPLEIAKGNIRAYGLEQKIDARISDGTKALEPGEVDGIICAGMGGRLIIDILREGKDKIWDMSQLILQPQSEIAEVRRFLRDAGFQIEKEDMVCEDGKYYPMMRVVPGSFGKSEDKISATMQDVNLHKDGLPPNISEISRDEAAMLIRVKDTYGPYLLAKSHPVLKQFLLWQKENLENILGNLKASKKPNMRQLYRIEELDRELGDIVFCLYNFYKV